MEDKGPEKSILEYAGLTELGAPKVKRNKGGKPKGYKYPKHKEFIINGKSYKFDFPVTIHEAKTIAHGFGWTAPKARSYKTIYPDNYKKYLKETYASGKAPLGMRKFDSKYKGLWGMNRNTKRRIKRQRAKEDGRGASPFKYVNRGNPSNANDCLPEVYNTGWTDGRKNPRKVRY